MLFIITTGFAGGYLEFGHFAIISVCIQEMHGVLVKGEFGGKIFT